MDNEEKDTKMLIADAVVTDVLSGKWTFCSSQDLTEQGQKVNPETFNRKQEIFVDYTQFELPAGTAVNRIPLPDSSGAYTDTMAQIVLKDPLFPWYGAKDQTGPVPQAALLMVRETEMNWNGTPVMDQTSVGDVLKEKEDVLIPVFEPAAESTKSKMCRSVYMDTELFDRIAPRSQELALLAHCRKTTIDDKAEMDLNPDGLFSVVVCNRLPRYRCQENNRYYMLFVSLQGHEGHLDKKASQTGKSKIQLIVLDEWSFEVSGEAPVSFRSFVEKLPLNCDMMLRLPAEIHERFHDGFVPEKFHTRTGEEGICWYRSPFTPVICGKRKRSSPFASADSALIYDPKAGVFDASLASAWECGRLAALKDPVFGDHLMNLRMKLQKWNEGEAGKRCVKKLYSRAVFNATEKVKDVKNGNLPEIFGDELDVLTEWLGRLNLLYQVPLHFLLPHKALLPLESLRFFYVDENWINALTDGAISIGVDCSGQREWNRVMYDGLIEGTRSRLQEYRAKLYGKPCGERSDVMSGFILYSMAAAFWPTMSVRGEDESGNILPILRMQLLSQYHLLVIFDGTVKKVICEEPKETVEMRVDKEKESFRDDAEVLAISVTDWKGSADFALHYLTWGDRVVFRKGEEDGGTDHL